jgi:hypothetical protein
MVQKGDTFSSMEDARDAVQRHVLDDGESYKTTKSDKKRYIIVCKDNECGFRIRVANVKKTGPTVTILKAHSCRPTVHYKNKKSHSIKYLIEHHRASIIDNSRITATQIRSNERLNYNNDINYKQAYRTIQAALDEMYGDEAESFAKFPAYRERFMAADEGNYCNIQVNKETGSFMGIFFAPAGLRHAHESMVELIGFDGTHTASRFKMNLLIAGGVDANSKTLPLAWALVPIENGPWWRWFLKHLKKAFKNTTMKGFILMSDREKGIPVAQEEIFPKASLSYCC